MSEEGLEVSIHLRAQQMGGETLVTWNFFFPGFDPTASFLFIFIYTIYIIIAILR